ncbi:MAG: helix-turn-helix domain-containing protein, partial [Gammaproteobacteria bacterium]|nr:helix-turn-helix domain-containing protein [Gammaproteobacteria bacterium]
MKKKYIVRLTDDENKQLEEIVKKGKTSAYKITHANILLTIDANGPVWSDEKTAASLRCHRNTVCNIRQRLVEKGMEMALERKQLETPSRKRILDGEGEARLIA